MTFVAIGALGVKTSIWYLLKFNNVLKGLQMFKEHHPKTLTNTEADAEANTDGHVTIIVIHVQCTA